METKNYIEAVGRRKTASARVRLVESTKNSVTVNEKDVATYFETAALQKVALESLQHPQAPSKFKVTAHIAGGGIASQAEALRLGIARALTKFKPEVRTALKKEGFLKRDQRAKERRKFGLKKARKAPQWSKR